MYQHQPRRFTGPFLQPRMTCCCIELTVGKLSFNDNFDHAGMVTEQVSDDKCNQNFR